ncbi:undecaprenyl-diphosphatase UppP [bacterium]|nr:undecaprenyl-diphosphatase UppP [candidate division CSSED10-310 bacterium]
MIHSLLMGILQGLTEFLPISSSGHLVLVESMIPGFKTPGMIFDVLLHAGTLLAVLIYYRAELIWLITGAIGRLDEDANKIARTWVLGLTLATIPAAVMGLLAENSIEALFDNPIWVSFFLFGTGCILLVGEWLGSRNSQVLNPSDRLNMKKALWVGMAQAVALIPGISRSGSTIATGIALGWSREKAARFSFLLMIPAVSGAVLLKVNDMGEFIASGDIVLKELIIGFFAAFLSGYCAIALMLRMIRRYSFKVFSLYCMAAGSISLIIQLLRSHGSTYL